MTLANGQVLQNRYRIISLLGQGGMGAVYRAWDTRLSISIALKEMIPQPGLDLQTLTHLRHQFQQEATVLARLHHPRLVRVTDFFEEAGNAYLVMDFVEGESLAGRIEREGALPETQALAWTEQLLDALGYCHSQGIIHRDVKPQNVIIQPDGRAVLVDFGLVKLWDARDPRTRTAMRGMGTPEYAPPEQYDAAMGHTGPRSDIYSLGATLYHALTGQAPPTVTQRIADPGTFHPPRMLNPRLSPRIEATVLRATELAVGNRFATTQEMAATLRGEAVAPPPLGAPPREKTRVIPGARPAPPARRGRVPVWAWALGGLAVLLLVVGMVIGLGLIRGIIATPQPTEGVVVAVAEETVTPSPSPSPSSTATHTPTSTSTRTPTSAPTSTPTPTAPATPEATPAPGTAAPTHTPQPTSPPTSGALITFEQWGTWRRGDQPYGELTQTQEQAHSGLYAAKLNYDFPVTEEDFVVFVHPLGLAGQPDTVGAWVYGDGCGHYLNVWVQDAQGENWSVHLGRVGGSGWRQMAGTLDASLPWPSGHISGPDNGVIDYPVRFYALVLDRPGGGPQSGEIYVDDISAWRSQVGATATSPPVTTATPVVGEATATATTETPVSAGPLYFPKPTVLDAWETENGSYKATIILHISGGAPPFTIHHDAEMFVTEERDYHLVFSAAGCTIVHSITVESADGQSVSHQYFIHSPWCD